MIRDISWNSRSINTPGALERLQNLKLHNLTMINMLEPFAHQSPIESIISHLQIGHVHCNVNNKILLFWTCDVKYKGVEVHDQHVTCEINHLDCTNIFLVTYVYA